MSENRLNDCDIVIEVDSPTNSDEMFYPVEQFCRSRFLMHRTNPGGDIPSAYVGCSEFPGCLIGIALKDKVGVKHDPITDEECEQLRETINRATEQRSGFKYRFNTEQAKHVEKQLNDEEALIWQFWMRRLVDSAKAKVKKGVAKLETAAALREKLGDTIPTPNLSGFPNDYYRTPEEIQARRDRQTARSAAAGAARKDAAS